MGNFFITAALHLEMYTMYHKYNIYAFTQSNFQLQQNASFEPMMFSSYTDLQLTTYMF